MTNHGHPRRLGYDTFCLTCDGEIFADDRAYTERGVGAWHEDCDTPRNLRLYQRERDREVRRRPQRHQHSNVDDATL